MNLTEVAKTLGEPTEVVRDWIQNGQLVGLKVGEDWRVARDEVARFEKERPGRGRHT